LFGGATRRSSSICQTCCAARARQAIAAAWEAELRLRVGRMLDGSAKARIAERLARR
jgi:hypothetical protein